MIIGPRLPRFTKSGVPAPLKPFAASSIPLVTIGVFILWLGWSVSMVVTISDGNC